MPSLQELGAALHGFRGIHHSETDPAIITACCCCCSQDLGASPANKNGEFFALLTVGMYCCCHIADWAYSHVVNIQDAILPCLIVSWWMVVNTPSLPSAISQCLQYVSYMVSPILPYLIYLADRYRECDSGRLKRTATKAIMTCPC